MKQAAFSIFLGFATVLGFSNGAAAVEPESAISNNVAEACAAKNQDLGRQGSKFERTFLSEVCAYYLGGATSTFSDVDLADDITFHGPIAGELSGRQVFEQGALQLFQAADAVNLKKIVIDGTSAILIVEYTLKNGKSVVMSEVWTKSSGKDSKLTRLELYFDPRVLLESL